MSKSQIIRITRLHGFNLWRVVARRYDQRSYPITPIIYILAGAMMLILSFLERPLESSIAILTILAGLPAYYLFGKQK